MNATSVKAALAGTIRALVEDKHIEAAPRDIQALAGEMASLVQAREAEALQHARDIAAANAIPSVRIVPESVNS
jgi:hypothetical protein